MKLPEKFLKIIHEEALKNANFRWYQGWEKSSGYIKSELRGDCRYGGCRVYIEWKKKTPPSPEQISLKLKERITSLLEGGEHSQDQRDFTHYILETYYVDVSRLQKEAVMSLENCLSKVIEVIEESELFYESYGQSLHNDLKNWQMGLDDHDSVKKFLESSRGKNK